MSDDLNPREFALLRYDQRKHPNDLSEYLKAFDQSCAWTWNDETFTNERAANSDGGTASRSGEGDSIPTTLGDAESANRGREIGGGTHEDQPLVAINGIAETRSAALHRVGIDNVGDLIEADEGTIADARGIGEKRAARLKEAALTFGENGYATVDPGETVEEIVVVDAEQGQTLREAGFGTVQKAAIADPDALAAVEGVDETQAEVIQRYAEKMTDKALAAEGGA